MELLGQPALGQLEPEPSTRILDASAGLQQFTIPIVKVLRHLLNDLGFTGWRQPERRQVFSDLSLPVRHSRSTSGEHQQPRNSGPIIRISRRLTDPYSR